MYKKPIAVCMPRKEYELIQRITKGDRNRLAYLPAPLCGCALAPIAGVGLVLSQGAEVSGESLNRRGGLKVHATYVLTHLRVRIGSEVTDDLMTERSLVSTYSHSLSVR